MKPNSNFEDFQIPKGYFESQKASLLQKAGGDFKVPEDYFLSEKASLLERVNVKKNESSSWYQKPIFRYVAILLAAGALLWWMIPSQETSSIYSQQTETILKEVYLNEEEPLALEDLDVVESYFGEVASVQLVSRKTPVSPSQPIQQKDISQLKADQNLNSNEEAVQDLLYELYLEEEENDETLIEEEWEEYLF